LIPSIHSHKQHKNALILSSHAFTPHVAQTTQHNNDNFVFTSSIVLLSYHVALLSSLFSQTLCRLTSSIIFKCGLCFLPLHNQHKHAILLSFFLLQYWSFTLLCFPFFFAILVVYVALLCSLYLMNSLDKLMGKRLYFVFHELISWIVICIFYLMNLCEKNISKKNNSIKYIREKPIKIFEPNWLVWFSFNFEKYQKPNQLRVQLFGHWIHQKLV
jgi:hypothetical protein